MADKKVFDPNKIIDYSKDYYAILGLERGTLPTGNTFAEKQKLAEIVGKAYRKAAIASHPNFHPNDPTAEQRFKDALHAEWILIDPLLRRTYEAGGTLNLKQVGDGSAGDMDIDWSKVGTYRQGTPADTIGYGLFAVVTKRANELGLVPAFCPKDESHSYEWDWVIMGTDTAMPIKLSVSCVYDADEVLRLTSGADLEKSLPFKIYICIPRAALFFLRGEDERYEYDDGTVDVLTGKLQAAAYSDYNLLETTIEDEAIAYLAPGGGLNRDLAAFRDGTLVQRQIQIDTDAGQATWMNQSRMQDEDLKTLRMVLRAKSYQLVQDEKADQFLSQMPADESEEFPKGAGN